MKDHYKFGKNLKAILDMLGMTQAELSKRTGLTRAAVSQLISGARDPSLHTIVRILKVIPAQFENLVEFRCPPHKETVHVIEYSALERAEKRIEAYEAAREIMCKALLKVKWGEDCTACSCSCSNTATKALEDSDKALAEDDAAKSSETKEKK